MSRGKSSLITRKQSANLDRQFVELIAEHIDLLLAVTACILALWGLWTAEYAYVPALAIAGGVSFFVGFLASLGVSAIIEATFFFRDVHVYHTVDVAVFMVEIFGYGCVAWLGYRHREQQRRQKEMVLQAQHNDPVMPWAVANEVRTSLAAIRFLLFPLHAVEARDDTTRDPLRQATDELQRLEQIFSNMEKRSPEPNQSNV